MEQLSTLSDRSDILRDSSDKEVPQNWEMIQLQFKEIYSKDDWLKTEVVESVRKREERVWESVWESKWTSLSHM